LYALRLPGGHDRRRAGRGFARVEARWHHQAMARAAVVHAPEYGCDIGPHVFPMEKFELVRRALVEAGDVADGEILHPEPASREDLLLAHTPEYLDDLAHCRRSPRTACSELPLTSEIVRAYTYAAGGTVRAAREAMKRSVGVNIGGGFHHAYADMAAGFCYLNDLAIALLVLLRDGLVRRGAVVDADLHQGNGTAHLFRDQPDVFTFSIHQEHLYPVKERSDLDIGLENGTGDEEFNARLAEGLEQVWSHGPEVVLYQAGADPFEEDQLGALRLTHEGLAARDRLVLEGCARRGIPVVVTLGGGYARELSDTVRIHTRTCQIAIHLLDEPRA
jgi:acetoin utilization deacetylase AcuC-like enzyme